jgi:hypothetical protein
MVKKIFMPHDVEEILKIRLPIFDQKDFISLTRINMVCLLLGVCTILLLTLKIILLQIQVVMQNDDRGLWMTTWNSGIPP